MEDEDITVHEVPLTDLHTFLAAQSAAGLAVDPKIYAGLYLSTVGPSKGPTPPATSSGGQSPPPLTRSRHSP